MVTRSNKITALILAMVMVLGVFVPGTDLAYAKSKKTKAPAKVKGVKITVKANKMTIKWKKAKRTKKYQVYVKRNSGKWKKVKTLKKRRYTYKAKNNGKFTFRVRALNKGKKGKFSKKVSKKISCIPAIKVNKTRVTVEQGKSFTIKVTGYAASSASWTFDSEYLSANTNTGASKKFKGKTIGTSSVAVTDKKGNNEQLVEVTVKEKAPEPENKKFALDCEQNITVTEGEEFTLKVKGESNIIRYTLWDYDKTYLKMTSYNSQGASVSFLAFCAGTTKVIADSQEGITYTINITIEPENIDLPASSQGSDRSEGQ